MLAKARKIPIVTANQLNRAAYQVLNESTRDGKGVENKKIDQGKRIDPSMISESQLLLENVDWSCAIHREIGPDGVTYLAFKGLKDRSNKTGEIPGSAYFAHPFEKGNSMRLQEDYPLEMSLSRDDIRSVLGTSFDGDDGPDDDDAPPAKKGTLKSMLPPGAVARVPLSIE